MTFPDPVRADSGLAAFTSGGGLIEACAVLAETDAVGGPEENMDRFGVLNTADGWNVELERSNPWTACEGPRDEARRGRSEEGLVVYGAGGVRVADEKAHDGGWATGRRLFKLVFKPEEGVLRSERR